MQRLIDNYCDAPWLGGRVSSAVGLPLRVAALSGWWHHRGRAVGRKEHVPKAADPQTDRHTPAAAVCTLFWHSSRETQHISHEAAIYERKFSGILFLSLWVFFFFWSVDSWKTDSWSVSQLISHNGCL